VRHFHHDHTFPVEPAMLLELWLDQDAVRARHEATGHEVTSVTVERADDRATVTTAFRTRPELPGALRRAVPAVLAMTQRDTWILDGAARGSWELTSSGIPSRALGTMRLDVVSQGARMVIEGDVAVSVPLVGGRLEALACDTMRKTLDAAHAFSMSQVLQRS
jgi:hypothetical protein